MAEDDPGCIVVAALSRPEHSNVATKSLDNGKTCPRPKRKHAAVSRENEGVTAVGTRKSKRLAINRISFCSLPAEIRNAIYEAALVQDSPIEIGTGRKCAIQADTQLFRVSKSVRREALPYFFSSNAFSFDNMEALADWLQLIGRGARVSLRRIGFHDGNEHAHDTSPPPSPEWKCKPFSEDPSQGAHRRATRRVSSLLADAAAVAGDGGLQRLVVRYNYCSCNMGGLLRLLQ
ncbi:hypothetical protein CTA2_9962, partial [Colletotrichum tanaceti]